MTHHVIISNLASLAIIEEAFENKIIPVKNDECEVSTALSDPLDCFSNPLVISKDGIKWVKAEISHQISMCGVFHGRFVY
jgi:hypothetical protein